MFFKQHTQKFEVIIAIRKDDKPTCGKIKGENSRS